MEVVANAEEHRVKILLEQFKERSNISAVQTEAKLSEYREKLRILTEHNRYGKSIIPVTCAWIILFCDV